MAWDTAGLGLLQLFSVFLGIQFQCFSTSKESSTFLKQFYFCHAKYRPASNSAGVVARILRANQIRACLKRHVRPEMNINLLLS